MAAPAAPVDSASQPPLQDKPGGAAWMMGTEAFESRMAHHESIEALWEKKWRIPCTYSVYPFHDGQYADFEPIFRALIRDRINDGTSTEYTSAFFPVAKLITEQADKAAEKGNRALASTLYLRAACLYRIARFPYITSFPDINCPVKWQAWEAQKDVYMRAASQWDLPIQEVMVRHEHGRGLDRALIPIYVRMPTLAPTTGSVPPRPVVLLMTGLDGYRPDNTTRCDEFIARGWAVIVVEIPGTADCPADPADPESPDRLWDSLFSWMVADGRFRMNRVVVWGLSAGGYYAIRIAHTHKDQLAGSVAQGAGCHYFFDPQWLDKADGHEYPFELLPALAMKYGYKTVEELKKDGQAKFSLLRAGLLERPSARLFLVNGGLDGLMPIEDSMLVCARGFPKEAAFFETAVHMGYPSANHSVYPWMEALLKEE